MSFSGQIAEIPLGSRGLTGNVDPALADPGELLTADNVTFRGGPAQKEGGASKFTASAISGTPEILGGVEWNHDGGTQRTIILTDAGVLLKDTGGGTFGVTLKSGLTVTNATVPSFVEGGLEAAGNSRKLFIFLGGDQVQVLAADGATTADLTTPPADWASVFPVFGLNHEGRMWGGGNSNDPHRLYYSSTTNHEDFTGAGSGTLSIFPGEGEALRAAISFKGLIVCFKNPIGIYAVDTRDPAIGNWKISRINTEIGIANPGALAAVQDDILFIDQTGGLRLISAVDQFGNIGSASLGDLGDIDKFIEDNFNKAQLPLWRVRNYPLRREVHIGVARTGSSVNDGRLVWDLSSTARAQQPRWRFSTRDNPVSMWTFKENGIPMLYMGDNAGFVWKLDQETFNKDSVAYNAELKTVHMDFSTIDPALANRRKNGRFIELVVTPKGNWDVLCDVTWDGELAQTIQFNMGSDGAALDTFILDTDVLSGEEILNRKKRMIGSGLRLQLTFRQNGLNQDFSIGKVLVGFTVGGDKLLV